MNNISIFQKKIPCVDSEKNDNKLFNLLDNGTVGSDFVNLGLRKLFIAGQNTKYSPKCLANTLNIWVFRGIKKNEEKQ